MGAEFRPDVPPSGTEGNKSQSVDPRARKRTDIVLGFQAFIILLALGLGAWVVLSVPPGTRMLVHSRHGSPMQLAPIAVLVPSIPLYFPFIVSLRERKRDPETTVKQMVGGMIAVAAAALLFLGGEIVFAVGFWQEAGVL